MLRQQRRTPVHFPAISVIFTFARHSAPEQPRGQVTMGFLTRLAICIGIIYWFAPEPTGYRAGYEMRQEQNRAEAVLTALTGLHARPGASPDEIEALAVNAGRALAALDAPTRRMLIERYFGPDAPAPLLQGTIN